MLICRVMRAKGLFEQDIDQDALLKLGAMCLVRLGSHSISLQTTSNLAEFERQMVELGKVENYPMTSVAWHDLASRDAFGLLVLSNDREIIGGVAARAINLGSDSLDHHWRTSYSRMYPGEGPAVSSDLGIAKEIQGLVVYQGELFIRRDWRGGRAQVPVIMHYLHVLCATKWDPDWLYGFVRPGGVRNAPSYGFSRIYPGAQTWHRKCYRRGSDEYLVVLKDTEISERAKFFVRNPSLFDKLIKWESSN